LRNFDHATVALLMVLVIVGLATRWGPLEALFGAITGGIGFDYFFLPPDGFGIAAPQHWIALVAFLVTAIVTGQLAARSKRRRIEAEDRQIDLEKLHRLANALLNDGNAESTLAHTADKLLEVFGTDGVALYDKHAGLIVRSGPAAAAISDRELQTTAISGLSVLDSGVPAISLAPVWHGGEIAGSIGVRGARLSERLLNAVASQVGLGLARLYAIEKTTEAEVVRRSEELKSAVLDAMAHEIRNPLNSVKLAATTLRSGHVCSELDREEMLAIIEEEANRMDRSIEEALQLSRVEAGQLSLRKEPQNLARLIPAAIEEMGAGAASRVIQVRVPESLPPADCDQAMIARVLKQLLNNALKYSPENSPITVSAEFTAASIVIDVVDGGSGVPAEEQDRIFEKYYRGRAVRSRTPGTGLGLASAKCIVQAHGGEIWVTTPPDGGAAFHVSLPLAATSQPVGVT
jgi:two-component system sensor histidine kinase KdpD